LQPLLHACKLTLSSEALVDNRNGEMMQVRDNLELSFVQEAEMVFTTLSSTGRKIFNHLENAFENVLVDEAAQASEIAVLQPLMLGCKRCVIQSFINETLFPMFNTHQGSQHIDWCHATAVPAGKCDAAELDYVHAKRLPSG